MSYPSNGPDSASIKSYFRRWRNLEDQKNAVSEDLKALFTEIKGDGHDTKAVRAAFRRVLDSEDTETVQAAEAFDEIVELYVSALSGTKIATGAHPAQTSSHAADAASPADSTRVTSPAGAEGEEDRQPIQAETPNQYAAASGVVESRNDIGGDHDNSAEKVGAPVIIEPETLPPAVVSDAGDRDTAETSDAAIPVVPLRTHNPETHFLNSEGLPRLHGCLKPDSCAGTWRALCSRCSPHEAPAA